MLQKYAGRSRRQTGSANRIISSYLQGVELNCRSSELLEPGILKMAFCYKAIDSDLKDAVQRKLLKEVFRKIKLSIRNLTFSDLLRKFRIFYIKKNEKGEASVRLFRIPIYKYSLK